MSIAPLCMKVDYVKFDDKEVVNKSYLNFWTILIEYQKTITIQKD